MTKTKKVHQLNTLSKGDNVVLPSHGVGVLADIETKVIMGQEFSFYKVHFKEELLDVFVPFEKFSESGLRKVVAGNAIISEIFDILKKQPRNQRGVWNKRMQEYDAKLYSGVLKLTAEVLRDSFVCAIDSNRSYTERTRYKMALHRVCAELAIASSKKYEDIENEVIATLRAVQDKRDDKIENITSKEEDELDEIYNQIMKKSASK